MPLGISLSIWRQVLFGPRGGSEFVPGADFSDPRNSQYLILLFDL